MLNKIQHRPDKEKKIKFERIGLSIVIWLISIWISKGIYEIISFMYESSQSSLSSDSINNSHLWQYSVEQIEADSLSIKEIENHIGNHLRANKVKIIKSNKSNLTLGDLAWIKNKIFKIYPFISWKLSTIDIIFYIWWEPKPQSFSWKEMWIYTTWKSPEEIKQEITENIIKIEEKILFDTVKEIVEWEIQRKLKCDLVTIEHNTNLNDDDLVAIKDTINGIDNLIPWKLNDIKISISYNSDQKIRSCWKNKYCLFIKWKYSAKIWHELNTINRNKK